jgi:hypothetical protein
MDSQLRLAGCSVHPWQAVLWLAEVCERPVDNGSEAASELELVLHDAEAHNKHESRERKGNRPKQPFSLLHLADICRIHAHHPRDESEGQEYNGHGGEYEYRLVVVLSSNLD